MLEAEGYDVDAKIRLQIIAAEEERIRAEKEEVCSTWKAGFLQRAFDGDALPSAIKKQPRRKKPAAKR